MKLLTRLFTLVVMTLLPLIGSGIYHEFGEISLRITEGSDQVLRFARLVAQEQLYIVESTRQLLNMLGKIPVIRDHQVAECNAFLAELISDYPQYVSFVSIDPAGHSICTGGDAEPNADLADRAYVKQAMQTHIFTSGECDGDKQSQRRAIPLALSYADTKGDIAGVIVAELDLDWLSAKLAHSPLPSKAIIAIFDRTGSVLTTYPQDGRFLGPPVLRQPHADLPSGSEGVQEVLGHDGNDRIYAYTPLPGGPPGLTLSVGLDKTELLKGSLTENRGDVIMIAGSCALALVLAGLGARTFISQPILLLLKAAEHWRQGNLNARVPICEARSEFGRLGAAFNAMAAAISAREQDLERRVRERTEALTQAMQARQTTEGLLYEARKMETVGRLTGGIAHDFNNLLAAIVGNIELARTHLSPRHPEQPRLGAALHSASRGALLVQQLLAFACRQTLRPEIIDLNQWVEQTKTTLRRLLLSNIIIETNLWPDAGWVRVDPKQLEAAVLNLAINARDAMPNGGILRLITRNVSLVRHANPMELTGNFVALSVQDTGTGMRPDVLEKAFEPFFTTKKIGAGSGLGLSMVQGFARQSSGSVGIESTVGKGTSVTLYLPRTAETADAENTRVFSGDPYPQTEFRRTVPGKPS